MHSFRRQFKWLPTRESDCQGKELTFDPKELEVRAIFSQRAKRWLKTRTAGPWLPDKLLLPLQKVASSRPGDASVAEISAAASLAALPKMRKRRFVNGLFLRAANEIKASPLNGMPAHRSAVPGNPEGTPQEQAIYDLSRRNFLVSGFFASDGRNIGLTAHPDALLHGPQCVREARHR
jgi:cation/acetate symporter